MTIPINSIRLFLVIFSAITIAVADALIKQISTHGNFWAAFKSPWMILVYFLYFIQILFAIDIFIFKGGLAVYTNLFIAFYSILGIIFGVLIFKEGLSAAQITGIILALIGAFLINK